MAVAKVILNGVTQMDLTSDTVVAATLLSGETAHGKDGEAITGTASSGGGDDQFAKLVNGTITDASDSSITYIDKYAFAYRSALSSVYFPEVSSISYNAFESCYSLTEVTDTQFPKLSTMDACTSAFQHCNNISIVSFSNLKYIAAGNVFAYCSNLQSVYLPSVSYIGAQSVFYACSKLTDVYLPTVSTIYGSSVFANCASLSSINFPSLFALGSYVFNLCSNLTYISAPLLDYVRCGAFQSCYGLTYVELPSLNATSSYAFYEGSVFANCSNLQSVSFANAKTLGSNFFTNCSSLQAMYAPNLERIERNAFYGCSNFYSGSVLELSFLKIIGSNAFQSCVNIESVSFPVLNDIGDSAFYKTNITGCYAPNISKIGNYAFASCSFLKSISFNEVHYISGNAFRNCTTMSNLYMSAISAITVGSLSWGIHTISLCAFCYCTSLAKASLFSITASSVSATFWNDYNLETVILQLADYTSNNLTISNSTFANCYNLLSLYLLGDTQYSFVLSVPGALFSTPISTYTTSTGGIRGSIFVPESKYASYISATNWAAFSSRFVSLTDAQIQNVLTYGTHEPQV